MSSFTPNLGLEKPDFNVATWHDAVNGNFDILDLAVQAGLVPQIRFSLYVSGKPASNELLVRYLVVDKIRFPASLLASDGSSIIPSTGNSVFSFKLNNVQFGIATFGPGSSDALFAGADTLFNAGDILTITAPPVQDTTLSGVSITLAATKEP